MYYIMCMNVERRNKRGSFCVAGAVYLTTEVSTHNYPNKPKY